VGLGRRVGSRNIGEIELSHAVADGWPAVLNWLQRMELLRAVGVKPLR
jgi:hypothetical protein